MASVPVTRPQFPFCDSVVRAVNVYGFHTEYLNILHIRGRPFSFPWSHLSLSDSPVEPIEGDGHLTDRQGHCIVQARVCRPEYKSLSTLSCPTLRNPAVEYFDQALHANRDPRGGRLRL